MNCPTCGNELKRHPWNTAVDVLACETIGCERFRNPIPIPIGDKLPETMAELSGRLADIKRGRDMKLRLERLKAKFVSRGQSREG